MRTFHAPACAPNWLAPARLIGSGVNYDYSVLSLATPRRDFDHSWEIFTDVALNPSLTKEDVTLTQSRLVASIGMTPMIRYLPPASARASRLCGSSLFESR